MSCWCCCCCRPCCQLCSALASGCSLSITLTPSLLLSGSARCLCGAQSPKLLLPLEWHLCCCLNPQLFYYDILSSNPAGFTRPSPPSCCCTSGACGRRCRDRATAPPPRRAACGSARWVGGRWMGGVGRAGAGQVSLMESSPPAEAPEKCISCVAASRGSRTAPVLCPAGAGGAAAP